MDLIIGEQKIQLYHCSIEELSEYIKPESVDLILTDPPYAREFLDIWSMLGSFASYALKNTGSLLTMSSTAYLPEVLAALQGHSELRYQWTLCLRYVPGEAAGSFLARGIPLILWKPILWYVKGKRNRDHSFIDLVHGHRKDKNYHQWGQNMADFRSLLVKLEVGKGITVVDPFLGGGATAVATVAEGANFIGCDIDKECIEITEKRLNERQLFLQVENNRNKIENNEKQSFFNIETNNS